MHIEESSKRGQDLFGMLVARSRNRDLCRSKSHAMIGSATRKPDAGCITSLHLNPNKTTVAQQVRQFVCAGVSTHRDANAETLT